MFSQKRLADIKTQLNDILKNFRFLQRIEGSEVAGVFNWGPRASVCLFKVRFSVFDAFNNPGRALAQTLRKARVRMMTKPVSVRLCYDVKTCQRLAGAYLSSSA